jgi:hypothetical protein
MLEVDRALYRDSFLFTDTHTNTIDCYCRQPAKTALNPTTTTKIIFKKKPVEEDDKNKMFHKQLQHIMYI